MELKHSTRAPDRKMLKPVKRRVRTTESVESRTLKAHWDEFRGKNVIVIGKEIYPIENGDQAARLLEELRQKYPKKTPLLAYVWGEETYLYSRQSSL